MMFARIYRHINKNVYSLINVHKAQEQRGIIFWDRISSDF